MVNSPNWTNTGLSIVLISVNLFRHPTLIEHNIVLDHSEMHNTYGHLKQTLLSFISFSFEKTFS